MPINFGAITLKGLKIGATPFAKAFVGTLQVYPNQAIVPTGFAYSNYSQEFGSPETFITFKSDGSIIGSDELAFNDIEILPPWTSPITGGVGSGVWIKAVQTSSDGGLYTGVQLGVRLPLTTDKRFSVSSTSARRVDTQVFSVEFWNASSGGALLSSGTMTIQTLKWRDPGDGIGETP